jgi:hypothetical protein
MYEFFKDFAGPIATIIAAVAAVSVTAYFACYQKRIAREQLRQNLYDRSFAIYMAFHELLVAVTSSFSVNVELHKANAARAQSPFLLTPSIKVYLQELHNEAFKVNAQGRLLQDHNYRAGISKPDFAAQASKLSSDKLALANRIEELAERFKPLIELKNL